MTAKWKRSMTKEQCKWWLMSMSMIVDDKEMDDRWYVRREDSMIKRMMGNNSRWEIE